MPGTMTTMNTNTLYTNELYRRLIQQFPTPSELFAYLRSEAGGSLTVIEEPIATPEVPFALIRYDKTKSNFGIYHVPFFRSVVWDIRAHRPVSVAPRRSTPITEDCPGANFHENYTVEEFVDGVMIQMWWHGGGWMIATRSNIGANRSFYGKRPYAELFWEAMRASNVVLGALDKKFVYSWVLQHPEERIVVQTPYAIPRVRLVELSEITPTNEHLVYENPMTQVDVSLHSVLVERHAINSMKECHDRVKIWGQRYKAGWQGLVIKGLNLSGEYSRWKIRSEEYMHARALRGNQAKREFTWLDHWTKGTLYDYLKIYPEEDVKANHVIADFKAETQRVYDLYLDVYFNHKMPLGQVPSKYRKCLWELKQKNLNRYFGNVRDYMNGLDTARKLWLLNFDRRFGSATAEVPEEDVKI
jgi:hypothetical protein